MSQRPLGAQISHMLKSAGTEVIFGIPGVHNQEMYRGIEEAGIQHVLARHEQGAGFMADGYARATGRPGVAYVITGPGACNIMTPVGQAYSDSVPVLVLSSCLDEAAARRGQLHQMKDQEAALACVADWSATARTADAAYDLIRRASAEFVAQRPRPKHIQVPIKLLQANAPEGLAAHAALTHSSLSAEVTEEVADRIATARQPLFILGGGARHSAKLWREVLELTGAASFVTYAGRGIVSEGGLHFGSMLARPGSADVIATSDLVIAVGTELSETDLWRDELGHSAPMIRVDIDPEVLSADQSQTSVCADASEFAKSILAQSARFERETNWVASEVQSQVRLWRSEVEAERPGIAPVADALRAALPEGTMIYSDMTQFAYAAKEIWPMDRPGHWHHPTGFGTLGYALPAAIGGKVGLGSQPVMAILGDYGFQYTVQELGVAVELGLPLPIVIWDNGKLGEIEDSMVRSQIAPNAVVQCNPDFLALARAYGAYAEQPETLHDLAPILDKAFGADGPTVIRIKSDIALG